MFSRRRLGVALAVGLAAALAAGCGAPPATPTPTQTRASVPTTAAAVSASATLTSTGTAASPAATTAVPPTDSATTPAVTSTLTATETPTLTRTLPTDTPTPAMSDTPGPSPTGTRASSPTEDEPTPVFRAEVLLEENFDDEIADGWQVQGGAWGIRAREYDQSSLEGSGWSYHPALVYEDYSAEVNLKLAPEAYDDEDKRQASLAVRMTNTARFCRATLDWRRNLLTLSQALGGEPTALTSRPLSLQPDIWYHLRVVVRGPVMRAYVDGALQLEGSCPKPAEGFVGLQVSGGHFRFDNVRVATAPAYAPVTALPIVDTFDDGDSDHWMKLNGAWRVIDGALEQAHAGTADVWAYMPDFRGLADYRIEARIRALPGESSQESSPIGGQAGLALRMAGISYGYWGALDANTRQAQIQKRQEGKWTLLATQPLTYDVDLTEWHTLAFEAIGPKLRLYLDGVVWVETTDLTYKNGFFGIRTYRGQFTFDDVRVEVNPSGPTPVAPEPPQLPFEDNFDDGFAGGWKLVGLGWAVVDGALDQTQFSAGSQAEAWVDLRARNYAITADVRLALEAYNDAEHGRWIGLLIRRQDFDKGYWAVLKVRDRTAQIHLGNGFSWDRTISAAAPVEIDPNGWNTLRFEAFENQLRFRVNGELVLTANDSQWAEGGFGFRILAGHFQIDNVYVEEIDR